MREREIIAIVRRIHDRHFYHFFVSFSISRYEVFKVSSKMRYMYIEETRSVARGEWR